MSNTDPTKRSNRDPTKRSNMDHTMKTWIIIVLIIVRLYDKRDDFNLFRKLNYELPVRAATYEL
jgi:hypothetical protein